MYSYPTLSKPGRRSFGFGLIAQGPYVKIDTFALNLGLGRYTGTYKVGGTDQRCRGAVKTADR